METDPEVVVVSVVPVTPRDSHFASGIARFAETDFLSAFAELPDVFPEEPVADAGDEDVVVEEVAAFWLKDPEKERFVPYSEADLTRLFFAMVSLLFESARVESWARDSFMTSSRLIAESGIRAQDSKVRATAAFCAVDTIFFFM
jgi:hypothetical protein